MDDRAAAARACRPAGLIARANALPNFDLSIVEKADPKTGYYGEFAMVLSNTGGPVHELSVQPMFSLHADTSLPDGAGRTVAADLPINGYYIVQMSAALTALEM